MPISTDTPVIHTCSRVASVSSWERDVTYSQQIQSFATRQFCPAIAPHPRHRPYVGATITPGTDNGRNPSHTGNTPFTNGPRG